MINIPEGNILILFDGVCNLCNRSIQYIIRHDKKNRFLFAPLQGSVGQQIASQFAVDTSKIDSIILFDPKKGLYYKSTAVLKIATHLGFPLVLLGVFRIIPTPIRHWVYDYVAKNRYQWFGKKRDCMVPTQDLKSKFLE